MELGKKSCLFPIGISILTCFWGLYYEFALFFTGALLCLYLIYYIRSNKKLLVPTWSGTLIALLVLLICSLISVFYAVDPAMALIGFIRCLVLTVFALVIMQLSQAEKENCLLVIPFAGTIMVLVSIAAWFIPCIKADFFQAGRMQGFFQYANTFALYLLLGLTILVFQPTFRQRDYLLYGLLLAGVFLSGSRSVFILALLTLIILIIRNHRRGVILSSFFIVFMLIGMALALRLNNQQNIGRYLSLSLKSSTLNGRLLYWKDGLTLLLSHPFGLGYLGYYYMQPAIQTGVYSVRFIHNDFLQIALDFGIPALIAFSLAVIFALTSSRNSLLQKLLLILICLHCLVDFDLQFGAIDFILLLCLDYGNMKIIKKQNPRIWLNLTAVPISCIFLYFGVAFGASYFNNITLALNLYPGNLDAEVFQMHQESSPQLASQDADEILAQNRLCVAAWDEKALVAAVSGNYDEVVEDKNQAISIARYSIPEYEDYIYLLGRAITYYTQKGDEVSREKYLAIINTVPLKLHSLKNQTSSLAYRIQDRPCFELSSKTQQYLKEIGGSTK